MPVDLSKSLVIGISSRALFDLEETSHVFETQGETAYTKFPWWTRRVEDSQGILVINDYCRVKPCYCEMDTAHTRGQCRSTKAAKAALS